MTRPDSWMPLYVADYLADTQHLSTTQHGAFLLLLFAYWRRGERLPDSDSAFAQITKLTLKAWLQMRPTIAGLFKIEDGHWTNSRLEEELAEADRRYKAKSQAGAKNARKRWQRNASGMPVECGRDAQPQPHLNKHSGGEGFSNDGEGSGLQPVAVRDEAYWRRTISFFLKTKIWPTSAGPQPGYGGCECPKNLVVEFNLDGMTPPQELTAAFLRRSA